MNTVLNDRIDGLPEDFNGVFMLEESDYTVNGRTNPMPHLFLFTLEPDGRVKLTSYDMPAGYTKETFRLRAWAGCVPGSDPLRQVYPRPV